MATAFFCCLNQCACTPMFQCHDRENCFEVAPCLSARLTTELKSLLYAASVGSLQPCLSQHHGIATTYFQTKKVDHLGNADGPILEIFRSLQWGDKVDCKPLGLDKCLVGSWSVAA